MPSRKDSLMASVATDSQTVRVASSRGLTAWPITMLLVASLFIAAASAGFGRQGFEKSLTALVMPVGFVWLLVTTWMVLSWIQRRVDQRRWATAIWSVFTLLSTGPLPNLWMNHIESQIPPYRPEQEQTLDFVVVLGGGTSFGPTRSEVSSGGDRVVYAAQLYIQGHCKHLITTGTATVLLGQQTKLGPTEQTIEIWTKLGIPPSAITALPGSNTYEEMQNLKSMLSSLDDKRVGLLTSASHLPRAMRLAEAAGMTGLIPIPANHHGGDFARSMGYYFPSAQHLNKFAICQHEWMGSLIGR